MRDVTKRPAPRPPKRDCIEREAGFVQVNRLISFDRHLTDRGVRVYIAIYDHCWDGDMEAFPSQRLIAAKIGCSIDKVKDGIKELRARGLLFVSRRGLPAKNCYHFIRPDLVYSKEEIDFVANRRQKTREWEQNRVITPPKPYEPPEFTDDPDEGFTTDSKSNEVPDGACEPYLDGAGEPRPNSACGHSETDEALPLRGRENKTKGNKSPASPGRVRGDNLLSIREESADEGGTGRRCSDREGEMEPRRQRTYVTPWEDRGYKARDGRPFGSAGYDDPGVDQGAPESYGESPSGVHEAFANDRVAEPAPPKKTRPRASQGSPVTAQMPDYGTPTKALPVTITPAAEEKPAVCDDKLFSKLYGIWRAEIDARFGKATADIPTKAPFKDFKLKTCAAALMAKFVEDDPAEFSGAGAGAPDVTSKSGSRPNFTVLHSMIRVAIWDWSSIRESAAGKWVALDLKLPTLREVHLLADYLVSNIQTGIVGGTNNRTSAYLAKFVSAAPETPTDSIGRIAKLENKSRAAVMREVKGGRVLG